MGFFPTFLALFSCWKMEKNTWFSNAFWCFCSFAMAVQCFSVTNVPGKCARQPESFFWAKLSFFAGIIMHSYQIQKIFWLSFLVGTWKKILDFRMHFGVFAVLLWLFNVSAWRMCLENVRGSPRAFFEQNNRFLVE